MISIKPQIELSGAMDSLKKLKKTLEDIKRTVKDLNEALEKASKLSGSIGGGKSNLFGGKSNGGGVGKLIALDFILNISRLFPTAIKSVLDILISKGMDFMINKGGGVIDVFKNIGKFLPASMKSAEGDTYGGLKALATSFAPEIVLAVAAITAFVTALTLGTKYLADVTKLYVSGGSWSSSQGVLAANNALGSDVSGIGRNLQNGYGPMVAAQAGVNPLGGPFGDMDYNKKTLKVLELIAKQTDFTKARRIGEMAGSPEAAQFALLNKVSQWMILTQGKDKSNNGNEGTFANFKAQVSIGWTLFVKQLSIMADPFLKLVTIILEIVNFGNMLTNVINPVLAAFKGLSSILQILLNIFDWIASLFGAGKSQQNAIKDNTNAINNLNKSINQGTFGGGPRAQSATPKAQQSQGYYSVNPLSPYGVL